MDYRKLALEIAQAELTHGGLLRLRVSGDSMSPTISHGDAILVGPVQLEDLLLGDLVTILRGGTTFTHRVVGQGDGVCYTKGDNRRHTDEPAREDEILGRVEAVDRGARELHFRRRSWRWANPMLGMLGRLEAQLWRIGQGVSRRGGLSARGTLARALAVPIRFLRRLLLAAGQLLQTG